MSKANYYILLMLLGSHFTLAAELRDPTRPYHSSGTVSAGGHIYAKLNSIIVADDQATAVVNNRIYRLGQKVRGIKITQINRHSIKLANGQVITLFKSITNKK